MSFMLSSRSLKNMDRLHPDLARVVEEALKLSSVDFGVTGQAVRTAAQQHALYLAGNSQKDGYKNRSNHQTWPDGLGHAVDLTPFVNGKPILDDVGAWELYPHIASAMSRAARYLKLAHRVTWGGNWFDTFDKYGSAPEDMKAAVERYKKVHPGPDFIDGPHYQIS